MRQHALRLADARSASSSAGVAGRRTSRRAAGSSPQARRTPRSTPRSDTRRPTSRPPETRPSCWSRSARFRPRAPRSRSTRRLRRSTGSRARRAAAAPTAALRSRARRSTGQRAGTLPDVDWNQDISARSRTLARPASSRSARASRRPRLRALDLQIDGQTAGTGASAGDGGRPASRCSRRAPRRRRGLRERHADGRLREQHRVPRVERLRRGDRLAGRQRPAERGRRRRRGSSARSPTPASRASSRSARASRRPLTPGASTSRSTVRPRAPAQAPVTAARPASRPSRPVRTAVGEAAAGGASLSDYTRSVECRTPTARAASSRALRAAGVVSSPVEQRHRLRDHEHPQDRQVSRSSRTSSPLPIRVHFNLQIDGQTAGYRGEGRRRRTTGERTLNTGTHRSVRPARARAWRATARRSSALRQRRAVVASGDGAGPLNLDVTSGTDIVCVITNTRKTGKLEVRKNLVPADDTVTSTWNRRCDRRVPARAPATAVRRGADAQHGHAHGR